MAGFRITSDVQGGSLAKLAQRFLRLSKTVKRRERLAVKRALVITVGEVKKTIRDSGNPRWRPLSPFTLLARRHGGTKPLIDNGDLFNGITFQHNEISNEGFVGILRSSKTPDGKSLMNIGLIHELGVGPYVIPVTDKLRRFFWAMHFKSGGVIHPLSPNKTMILHPGIPARPFLSTTLARVLPRLQRELKITIQAGVQF